MARGESASDAIDPDVDLSVPGQRGELSAHRWILPAIALGGMVGSSARHGLELLWPTASGGFPWSTFVTNVSGCLLIGLLMVYVVEAVPAHPLLRPFLGVGVLGGYTTFSTYAVQAHTLVTDDRPALSLAYLFATVVSALAAVVVGVRVARWSLA